MVVEIIQRDIAAKGIGYIILRDCPEDRLGEGLGRGMEKLKRAGAKTVWATSLPEGEPLNAGPVGVWRLTHVHDTLRMEAPLPLPGPERKLSIRSPKRAAKDAALVDLVNRAYAEVPGFVSIRASDVRKQNHRCAVAWQGEKPVGCYELDLSEKVPGLCILAVEPELRRQGIGRSLLRAALDGLKSPTATLTVSSANAPALALFRSEGFRQTGLADRWFEVV